MKPKQSQIINEIVLNKRDVLAILPTGFGKSLCFELIPFLSKLHDCEKSPLVLVLCPLEWYYLSGILLIIQRIIFVCMYVCMYIRAPTCKLGKILDMTCLVSTYQLIIKSQVNDVWFSSKFNYSADARGQLLAQVNDDLRMSVNFR